VEIVGGYSQDDAVKLFQRSDLFLNIQYNDVCPRIVVEAMACGLPIVYSSSGGTPELVGEGAGVGIPAPVDWEQIHPPSPEAIARAVLQILGKYSAYSEYARACAVEKFDIQPWINRHKQIFEELIN
jgi:glycosyltransferase involved in cell wall biosynthesis